MFMSGSIVAGVEILARMRYGPDGAPTQVEKAGIEPSLARILARMPKSRAAQMAGLLDPLMLVAGLAMYGNRLAGLESKREGDKAVNEAHHIVRQNAQHNGVMPTANDNGVAQSTIGLNDPLLPPLPDIKASWNSQAPPIPSVDESITRWLNQGE